MTGLTYVLLHPGFCAVKVGFSTPKATRLTDFGRDGWQAYRTLEVTSHGMARRIEQAALFEIRFRRFIPPYLSRNEMSLCGWTETSSLGLISVRDVWDVVCEQAGLIQLSPHLTGPPDGRRRNGGTPPRRVRGDALPNSLMARTQARLEQVATNTTLKDTK
ncbi:hypothetical protein [Streptomyces sp. cg35]|uniref:hypothetical protein n=1 Tax=Streptomyces sp. cg35 TaxID=3421650 RepID=UPI003D16BD84